MTALKGNDCTVLGMTDGLVETECFLTPAVEGLHIKECQANQEAYIDSILHILLIICVRKIAASLEFLIIAFSCYATLFQHNDAVAMLYGA